MSLVIDASVIAAWAFSDERSSQSAALLKRVAREGATVPSLWIFEVSNLLLVGERRGRLTRADRDRFLSSIGSLPISAQPASVEDAENWLRVADAHALTAYDAAYLDLAARHRLPLATKDSQLVSACAKAGVEIVSI